MRLNILVNAIGLDFECPRGIENYAIGITRGLSRHVTQIYFYVQKSGAKYIEQEFAEFGNVHLLVVPDALPKQWSSKKNATIVFRAVRRLHVEVIRLYRKIIIFRFGRRIQIDGIFNPLHLTPYNKLLKVPSLSTVHRILDDYSIRQRDAAKSHLTHADIAVSCWPIPYKELTELLPKHADKVVQIPYLADHLLVKPDLDVKTKYDLPARFFFYPAVAIPRKNHANLIKAYGLLKKEGTRIPALICSGGFVDDAFRKEVERLIAENGLTSEVRFIGHVSNAEMAGLYSLCTAAICSSFNEAGMAVIQEGGYLGRPVICSNTPEAVAQAALYGWDLPMFDPSDPVNIADVIKLFLDEEAGFEDMARAASKKIQRYSSDYIGRCYAELFAWICEKGTKPLWFPFA